jgi:hypothetical protein
MALGDSYATLAELKARVTPQTSGTANDTAMTNALSVASRAVEAFCDRQFNTATSTTSRVYTALSPVLAFVNDFHTTTDLVIKTDEDGDGTYETTWTTSDYRLAPVNGVRHGEGGWPYWQIKVRPLSTYRFVECEDSIEVTAQWGWAAVPAAVKEATLALAEETFKLKDSPYGVAGFGDYGMIRVRDNPKISAMLTPYRRTTVRVR